uniref:Uncharacterized protein n=1 Tax=Octopus bimaculoides TaxID=37653 RepID=A0A0L8H3W6_OCTBM
MYTILCELLFIVTMHLYIIFNLLQFPCKGHIFLFLHEQLLLLGLLLYFVFFQLYCIYYVFAVLLYQYY